MGRNDWKHVDAVSRTQVSSHLRLHSPLRAQLVISEHQIEVQGLKTPAHPVQPSDLSSFDKHSLFRNPPCRISMKSPLLPSKLGIASAIISTKRLSFQRGRRG